MTCKAHGHKHAATVDMGVQVDVAAKPPIAQTSDSARATCSQAHSVLC